MSLRQKTVDFFDALNRHDLDSAVAMVSPAAEIRTPMGSFTGGEAYRDWISTLFRAIPDMTHEITGFFVEAGETIGFELHAWGTMSGPLAGPAGDIPPTGRPMDVPGADFWRFEDGRIVAYHLYFDYSDFVRQLGLPA
jgi:steroid delta-isomerase-like uncharacterized protein